MKFIPVLLSTILIAIAIVHPAEARNGFVLRLPDNRVAVLSEGDLEPASVGSFSITVFTSDDLSEFMTGGVFARDGSFLDNMGKPYVSFADITGDGKPELLVLSLTAGSGNYLSVQVLDISDNPVRSVVTFNTDTKHDVEKEAKAAYAKASNRY